MNESDQTLLEILHHCVKKHPQLLNSLNESSSKDDPDRLLRRFEETLDSNFHTFYKKNSRSELAHLCDLYGSDKGAASEGGHPYPWASHSYTDYYERLFGHCRSGVKQVFECGLGTNNPDLPSSMGAAAKPGASLRVWRDYFPNADIFGADIDKNILFEEDRIRTFYIDQLDPDAIGACWDKIGADSFDFIVDDGLHTFDAGITLFNHSIDKLSDCGIYVIEDVCFDDLVSFKNWFDGTDYLVDYVAMFRPGFALGDNSLVVVRKPDRY